MNLAAILVLFLLAVCRLAAAKVVLIGKNTTLSLDDVEANFTPTIKSSGERGVLYKAEPLDACTDLTNKIEKGSKSSSPFALIIRGRCSFEDKIRSAQKAGFKAAIVYDNEDGGILVSMAGNPSGVKIYAVFITTESGEILKKYAGCTDIELWLIPSFENSAWSIMAISFISLLAMSAVLATCFFVRRHRVRRRDPQSSRVREFRGMSSRLVQAMPSLIFTAVLEDKSTSCSCAICLEDYMVGDKLRILPCRHQFHAVCVDSWLTAWRTFCPVCKRDARTSNGDPPASESTPLLSSSLASSSSFLLSLSRSPSQSSNIQIAPPAQSPLASVSLSHSHASTSYGQQSHRTYRRSPSIPVSRSSVDLRNAYSQRAFISPRLGSSLRLAFVSHSHSQTSTPYLQQSHRSNRRSPPIPVCRSSVDLRNAYSQRVYASPHSLGYPNATSPLNAGYMSSYRPSPSNASPSLVGSSSHRANPLHCSVSAGTFSPFASALSLPES